MNSYKLTTAACALGLVFATGSRATAGPNQISFDMVVSGLPELVFRSPGRTSISCQTEPPKT